MNTIKIIITRNAHSILLLIIFLLTYFLITNNSAYSQSTAPWHEASRKYRIKLTLSPAVQLVAGSPIESSINFQQILQAANQAGTVNLNSLKLIEVNAQGAVVNSTVPFQFDQQSGNSGSLIFISPDLPANAIKNYYLYFDTGANFSLPNFQNQVSLTDNVNYQGQASYRLTTTNATYYYHKQGAGFASIIDTNNKDWLSYKPTGNYSGNFRGIPNMVHPEGFFHPGNTGSSSQILSQGPLKVVISSQTGNGLWKADWEVYPKFIKMTLKSQGHAYWFLYEGTPNGVFNPSTNQMTLSNGETFTTAQEWKKDIPNPEWLFFSDNGTNRSLFISHLEDDSHIDSYVNGGNIMTVFGFGRDGTKKFLTVTPAHFYVGITDTKSYNDVKRIISSFQYNIPLIKAGLEIRSGNITITPQASITLQPSITPQHTVTSTPPNGQTIFTLDVFLHGIGKGGDNMNPGSTGNMNPVRSTREIEIEVYNSNNNLTLTKSGVLTYQNTSGSYKGNINMQGLASGIYTAKVKVAQYLKKNVTGIITVTSGRINSLPVVKLVTGDSDNNNSLNIIDYNLILDCYSELSQPKNCNTQKKLMTDLTDDNTVNQFDYNLFLREISTQIGE